MMDLILDADWWLEPLWRSTLGYIAIMITLVGGVGAVWSRSMTVGAFAGYTLFVYFAITVEGPTLLLNILRVTLVLVLAGVGFKLVRLEAWGE